jgi:hypothetical protein
MNNIERYEQIIDEVYNNYLTYIHDVVQGENKIYGDWYGKEEFTNKCKTDPEFSEKWGLKIDERELSLEERKIHMSKYSNDRIYPDWDEKFLNEKNIPTKLITITYKDKTIETYD